MIDTRLIEKLFARLTLCGLALVFAAGPLLVAAQAEAKSKRAPPLLELEVFKGKEKIGVEVLRKVSFEKIVNFSTIAKVREGGRRFTQRTHTKLDHKHRVLQYNRWMDVKGASTRDIVFKIKDAWKLRSGDTTSGKFAVTELAAKSPIVLLDTRSPTLVSVAIDRAAGRTVSFVRVDNKTSGALTVRVEDLIDPKTSKLFKRYTLSGPDLKATALRDAQSKTVYVSGPGLYSGQAKGFKMPKELKKAPAAANDVVPTEAAAPGEGSLPKKAPLAPDATP